MKLTIARIARIKKAGDPHWHVHAAGCRDLNNQRRYSDHYTAEYADIEALTWDTFGHQIDENPGATWQDYAKSEFHILPCAADFPQDVGI